MSVYLVLKYLHILSAVSLFGIGVGTAFHLYHAHRRQRPGEIAAAANSAIVADLLFTAPAAVVQPATGLALALVVGYRLTEPWLILAYGFYAVAIGCWLGAFALQRRLRALASTAASSGATLADGYDTAIRRWIALGWVGLTCFLVVFALMTFKPGWP